MRFSALLEEGFGQTALSSLQHLKGNFSGASLSGFLPSLAKSYREDTGNGAYGFPSLSGTRLLNHLQLLQLRRQHIILRYPKTLSVDSGLGLQPSTSSALQRQTNQVEVFKGLLTSSYVFHITDIDKSETIDTWSHLPQINKILFRRNQRRER